MIIISEAIRSGDPGLMAFIQSEILRIRGEVLFLWYARKECAIINSDSDIFRKEADL